MNLNKWNRIIAIENSHRLPTSFRNSLFSDLIMAKSNDVNSFDLRRHETGFFLPEIDFDFLDAMLTETSNDGVDLNDASNDQDHRTTELSMNLRVRIDSERISKKKSLF